MSAAKTSDSAKSLGAIGKLPTFSGQNSDASEFLQNFLFYADFLNWTDQERVRAFPLALQGNARTWFTNMTAKYTKFTELSKAFSDHFLSRDNDWMLRQNLSSRHQLPSESISGYAADIQKRCQRLKITVHEQLHFFTQGLLPAIREYVILNKPKTFEEAVSLATLKSNVLQSHPSANAIAREVLSDFRNDVLESLQQHLEKQTETIAALQQDIEPFQFPSRFNQGQQRPSRSDNFQRPVSRRPNNLRFRPSGDFGRATRATDWDNNLLPLLRHGTSSKGVPY